MIFRFVLTNLKLYYIINFGQIKKNWLSYYSKFFKFVEVDSTFYNIPSRFVVEGWKDKTPDDFKFSLEFPKIITHEKKMQNNNSIESHEIIKEYFISFFCKKNSHQIISTIFDILYCPSIILF